ncbi:MAG: NTP transferase domain-containing protein, partial [Alphaproteobacteria bacterium]
MKFGETPVREAAGVILAHSIRERGISFRKGRVLSDIDVASLADAGIATVTAVQLDDGDLDENAAAARIGEAIAGANLAVSAPGTGRCNLNATKAGLAVIDPARVDALNLIDESVTLATLAPLSRVAAGDLVATVKIITFAVPGATVESCIGQAQGCVTVAPFRPHRVGLVQTRLPGLKPQIYVKAEQVTQARLTSLGCELTHNILCDHDVGAVAAALDELRAANCDIALVLGATAIADRADVIPAAVTTLGGEIEHFGMPVDPGNLMLLAGIGSMRVLGLPGSARSPRLHGFDWVLQRIIAGTGISGDGLMRMGVGGLLKEIPSRPQPRASAVTDEVDMPTNTPRIAAIILAAGQSRRMGSTNKLLAEIDGKPMVVHAADAALNSHADPVIVVTGHEPEQVAAALDGRAVELVHNPDFAD